MRRRRRRDLPRADLRRAHRGRVPVGHPAVAHRDREPRVPGAVRDVGASSTTASRPTATRSRSTAAPNPASSGGRREHAVSAQLGDGWDRDTLNQWIRYHSEISYALTMQRTALESALIPVTAYIVIACVECYRRYPEMMRGDRGREPPEEIGRAGHRVREPDRPRAPVGGAELHAARPQGARGARAHRLRTSDRRRSAPSFDFWDRAARAYRFDDGTHQAWDADGARDAVPRARRRDRRPSAVRCGRRRRGARDAPQRARSRRTSSCLWFDTRSGLPGHRPYRLDRRPRAAAARRSTGSACRTSRGAPRCRAGLPYSDVLAAFVLDGVDLRVTDFGTSVTQPAGLPPARRRVRRSSTSRRRRSDRSTTTGADASRPRRRTRSASCTARSRRWSGATRSTRARTSTSRSCAVRRVRRRRARLDRAARQPGSVPAPRADRGVRVEPMEQEPSTYYPPIP